MYEARCLHEDVKLLRGMAESLDQAANAMRHFLGLKKTTCYFSNDLNCLEWPLNLECIKRMLF